MDGFAEFLATVALYVAGTVFAVWLGGWLGKRIAKYDARRRAARKAALLASTRGIESLIDGVFYSSDAGRLVAEGTVGRVEDMKLVDYRWEMRITENGKIFVVYNYEIRPMNEDGAIKWLTENLSARRARGVIEEGLGIPVQTA
jgi:hypothetical protein